MADLATTLVGLGFTDDPTQAQADQAAAIEAGAGSGGEFSVNHVFTKNQIKVTVEQNSATEDVGGLSAVVTHPPVAVIESPNGRVAFNPSDVALAEVLIAQLS